MNWKLREGNCFLMKVIFGLWRLNQISEAAMEIVVKTVLNILWHLTNLHCCRSGTPRFWSARSGSVMSGGCGSSLCLFSVWEGYEITGLPDLGVKPSEAMMAAHSLLPTLLSSLQHYSPPRCSHSSHLCRKRKQKPANCCQMLVIPRPFLQGMLVFSKSPPVEQEVGQSFTLSTASLMRVFPVSSRGQLGSWEPQASLGQTCWTSTNHREVEGVLSLSFFKNTLFQLLPEPTQILANVFLLEIQGAYPPPCGWCWHWYNCGNSNIPFSKALFKTTVPHNLHLLGELCKWMAHHAFSYF